MAASDPHIAERPLRPLHRGGCIAAVRWHTVSHERLHRLPRRCLHVVEEQHVITCSGLAEVADVCACALLGVGAVHKHHAALWRLWPSGPTWKRDKGGAWRGRGVNWETGRHGGRT